MGRFFSKKNFFMAEMDRHQLALAYDAVVSSGAMRLETLAGWTHVP